MILSTRTMVDMLDELAITKSQRYGIAEMNEKKLP
jgi:hypothetical protein